MIGGKIEDLYLDTENHRIIDKKTGEIFEVLSQEDWKLALQVIAGFKVDVFSERKKQ